MKPRWESFDPVDAGLTVREVAMDLIYNNQGKDRVRWFHSAQDVDLYVWTNDSNKVIKQQLTFFGVVMEWNIIEGLKTGSVEDGDRLEVRRGPGASELIHFDSRPNVRIVARGRLLLAQITALESVLGRQLDDNFADQRAGTLMPAEEFVRRWGSR